MPPRRILVTGSAGFVGQHLLPALRTACPGAELHTAPFDVTDGAAAAAAVATAQPDAVVHLAAVAAISQARLDPGLAWNVNLTGTLNVARAIMAHAPALDEGAVPAPLNTYAATKAAADLALGAMAAEGLRVVRVRSFNHTGPGQAPGFVVPAFAEQVARIAAGLQPPVLRVGALDPMRDFLDVRDVCAAYTLCLVHADALAPGTVLNVASGQPRRVGDVLTTLMKAAGVQAEVVTDAGRLRPTDIPIAAGDAALARRLLGWAPAIPWEQTIADVLADWQARVQQAG